MSRVEYPRRERGQKKEQLVDKNCTREKRNKNLLNNIISCQLLGEIMEVFGDL